MTYRSLLDTCLDTIFSSNESYGVIILTMRFFSKVLTIFENECEFTNTAELSIS